MSDLMCHGGLKKAVKKDARHKARDPVQLPPSPKASAKLRHFSGTAKYFSEKVWKKTKKNERMHSGKELYVVFKPEE